MDVRLIAQGPALKIIFFGHLIPTVWGLQGDHLPSSYLLYNIFFLFGILWSLHAPESEDAILMTTFLDLVAILLDAVTIGMYTSNRPFTFAAFMLIINLLLRPITSLVLLRFFNERSGRYNTLGIPGFANYAGAPAGSNARTYQDIDATGYQTVPASLVDTGSPVKETNNFSGE